MNTDALFEELKQSVGDFLRNQSTRTLAAHRLLAVLFRIDAAAKAGEIAKGEKNRLVVLVLQHLSLILRVAGPGAIVNRFRSGNLLINSRPSLVIAGMDFSGLALPEFYLGGALLIACNFNEADLHGARFRTCQLQGCTFVRADLTSARFRRCTFYGCSFENANVRNARGLP